MGTMSIIPANKPQITPIDVRTILKAKGFNSVLPGSVVVLGIRGYFQDSMGKPGKNDRGMYDDAFCVAFSDHVVNFNGNTDPSAWRKGIAVLAKGIWHFIVGKHKVSYPAPRGHAAFRQFGTMTVHRDGQPDDTGDFAINFHRGGEETTSSLGCQTVHPDQWDDFRHMIYAELGVTEHDALEHPYGIPGKVITYVLIDEADKKALLKKAG